MGVFLFIGQASPRVFIIYFVVVMIRLQGLQMPVCFDGNAAGLVIAFAPFVFAGLLNGCQ